MRKKKGALWVWETMYTGTCLINACVLKASASMSQIMRHILHDRFDPRQVLGMTRDTQVRSQSDTHTVSTDSFE